ncbi:MAG: DUF1249 domain-containing protein [gamma proteobacterium symbiont of Lucinoma myriamae]|nr:DUF1249 domain-containing protein [gamma proteobacterium symbiont of Lucinoma myriamae]MCU7832896.1 DUF1249 domain-containing protein [gamma proteobacterium symbiont of Lucinoma myriamae]
MTHTINKTNHRTTTPTGLYEANYRRLLRLAPQISELHVKDDLLLSASRIALRILEQYKYTTVISLKQSLQTQLSTHLKTMTHLSVIDMELRICHDACLVEVIGYQGKSPIQSANIYPNKHMLQIDEKRQLNLFLKDVLESSLKTEYYQKCINSSCG